MNGRPYAWNMSYFVRQDASITRTYLFCFCYLCWHTSNLFHVIWEYS